MTLLLIVLLVLLWGSVIVPTLLRARQSPASSVGTFRKHLQALSERGGRGASRRSVTKSGVINPGRWIIAPPQSVSASAGRRRSGPPDGYGRDFDFGPQSRLSFGEGYDPTIEQRRQVFVALLAAAGVSLVLGLFPGLHVLLMVHVGIDVLLGCYVAYLLRAKAQRPRRELVTYETEEYQEERFLRAGQF